MCPLAEYELLSQTSLGSGWLAYGVVQPTCADSKEAICEQHGEIADRYCDCPDDCGARCRSERIASQLEPGAGAQSQRNHLPERGSRRQPPRHPPRLLDAAAMGREAAAGSPGYAADPARRLPGLQLSGVEQ